MTIHINSLMFETIIGLLPFERTAPQRITIDVVVEYIYQKNFIDYAMLVILIKNHLHQKEYHLLEEALLGLKEEIFSHHSNITMLFIKIIKPDILSDCKVGVSEKWTF